MKRFEGGYWSSKPPFGYVTERQPEGGSILVPAPGESELIPEIFERYADGKYSLRDIQRWLNASLPGKPKSRRGINQILQSRVYLGEVPYGRYVRSDFHSKPEEPEWRPGKHQALVTADMFDRVQEMLHENKRSFGKGSKGAPGPSRGGPNARYLFTGLIYCGACGSRYIGSKAGGNKWPRYICGRKHTGVGCASHNIYETRLRDAVVAPLEKLIGELNQEDLRAKIRTELVLQDEEARSVDQISKVGAAENLQRLEKRLSSLEDAFLDGDIHRERYRSRRDEFVSQIEELRKELATHIRPVLPDVERLFSLADALEGEPPDDTEWRQIIMGVVERIEMHERDIRVHWKPEFEPLMGTMRWS